MIDPADIAAMLLKAEATIHRKGWDQQPFLAVMSTPQPRTITLDELPLIVHSPPGPFLLRMGEGAILNDDFGNFILPMVKGEFLGMALAFEAWGMMSDDITDAERAELVAAGRSYADHPAGKEVRAVVACDVTGRNHCVTRNRGEKPRYETDEAGVKVGGPIHQALHYFTDAVLRVTDSSRS